MRNKKEYNTTCARCQMAINTVNGRWCTLTKRIVEYCNKPICIK